MKKTFFLLNFVLFASYAIFAQTITCPASITLNTNSDAVVDYNCSTMVKASDGVAPIIVDPNNIGILSHTVTGSTSRTGSGKVAGIVFNKGVNNVVYKVAPSNASCFFTITINDNEAPKLLAGFMPTSNVYDSQCDIFPSLSLPSPIYLDNCGGVAYSFMLVKDTILNVSGCSTKAKSLKYTKNLKRTWTATDPSGNKYTYLQNFYVRDSAGVVIPSLPTVARTWTGSVVAVPATAFDNATITDNCTPTQALNWTICKGVGCTSYASSITVYTEFVSGQTVAVPVTLRISDKCGNYTYKNTVLNITR